MALSYLEPVTISQKAPQPHDPEASKVTMYSGLLLMRVGIIDIPFHWVRKGYHYAIGLSGMTCLA